MNRKIFNGASPFPSTQFSALVLVKFRVYTRRTCSLRCVRRQKSKQSRNRKGYAKSGVVDPVAAITEFGLDRLGWWSVCSEPSTAVIASLHFHEMMSVSLLGTSSVAA